MSEHTVSIAACPVGVVPIVWNNVDLPELADPYDADFVLDEIARLGFDGCQHGQNFRDGPDLVADLESRDLRLAEVYASIPCDENGPSPDAYDIVIERLELLDRGGGEMLVLALDTHPERSAFAARTSEPRCPTLTDAGWERLSELLDRVSDQAESKQRHSSFHPHVGTFIENPAETSRLADVIRQTGIGLCLDVGHYLLGGGDPVRALSSHADLITHIHLKDVSPTVHADLARGEVAGFEAALRQRVFCELGSGLLDLAGVVQVLEDLSYQGWLMIEQDTSWLSPSEASAIGLHVARFAIRGLAAT